MIPRARRRPASVRWPRSATPLRRCRVRQPRGRAGVLSLRRLSGGAAVPAERQQPPWLRGPADRSGAARMLIEGEAVSRTIKFAKAGGPEVLEFITKEVAAPGPAEVRIKVKAIGLNRAESMWRNDKYISPVTYPAGLGYEAAGIVDAVGKDVTAIAVGDAVSTLPAFSLHQYF